jgi:acetyl-CoA acetyltransferase
MTSLRNVAVVGFSYAPIVEHDEHRTAQELLYVQIRRALEQCGVGRDAIDTQVAGSADYVDGKPFGFVQSLDVMGSWPPRRDSHLEMDAAFGVYYAWLRMQAEESDTALVVGYGKGSEGNHDRIANIRLDPYYQAAIGLEASSTSALQTSAYMAETGVTDRDLAASAARSFAAAAENPDGIVRKAPTAEELARTPWAVEPLRRGYIAPHGDSAVCLILAADRKAEAMCPRPAWIHGIDQRAEMQSLGARDLTRSRGARTATEKALEMADLRSAREVDVVELAAVHPVEEMILREAMKLEPFGDDEPAINPSGGAFSGNAFMMTGLIRIGEAFRQISGTARCRAVPGVRHAIAHAAQGHCLQQNLVVVLGAERRWS